MTKTKVLNWLQKNTMVLILVLVFAFFAWQTGENPEPPEHHQPDLAKRIRVYPGHRHAAVHPHRRQHRPSVGSVVCFTGAIGALLMAGGMNMWLAVVVMLLIGLAIGAFQAYWIAYVRVRPSSPPWRAC